MVSTDVGSVSEIVAEGETGRLVPRSGEGMAEAIKSVVDSLGKSDAMKEASSERARRLFSVRVMVEAHEKLYRELLG